MCSKRFQNDIAEMAGKSVPVAPSACACPAADTKIYKNVFFVFLACPKKKLVFLPKTIFFLGKTWFSCSKPFFPRENHKTILLESGRIVSQKMFFWFSLGKVRFCLGGHNVAIYNTALHRSAVQMGHLIERSAGLNTQRHK